MKVTCYSVLKSVVNDAVKHLNLTVDDVKESKMMDICEVIDQMSEEFGGISYEVIVHEGTHDIIIILDCDEIIIEDKESSIYNVFEEAKSISFKHGEDEESCAASFVFPGIWK